MNSFAVVSILYGALILALRVPLVVTPEKTIGFYRKLISNDTKIRILGFFGADLALVMIVSSLRSEQTGASVLLVFGCIVGVISVGLYLFNPSILKVLAEEFFDFDHPVHRVLGGVAAAFGVFFVCLGLSAVS